VTSGAGPSAAADVSFRDRHRRTKVLGVALGPLDAIVAEARVPTPPAPAHPEVASAAGDTGVEVAYAIADVVAQLDAAVRGSGAAGLAGDDAAPAVGVGAPGMLDREGRLRFAPNLPRPTG